MDELTLIRDLRPEPVTLDQSRVRARLLVEIDSERPGRRRRVGLATGLALAAAMAAAVVLVPWDQVTGGKPTSASADPRVVLADAAGYARQQPFTVPRPDQFVYIAPDRWLSVDGTHDSRFGTSISPGCKDGRQPVYGANDPTKNGTLQPCQPTPAYLPDLPTATDAMVGYLEREGSVNSIGKQIAYLLDTIWMSPRSKAALFEAATRIPGLSVVADATDYRGDHGIGVRWSGPGKGDAAMLVFDRTTHAYLGDVTFAEHGVRAGSLSALPSAIVDRLGQLPR